MSGYRFSRLSVSFSAHFRYFAWRCAVRVDHGSGPEKSGPWSTLCAVSYCICVWLLREPYVVVSRWMYNKWHVVVVMVPVWLLVAVTVVLILCDCVTTAFSFGCQPSTDSSATSAGHMWWSGVRCRRSIDVQLTAETFTRPF